MEESWGGEGLEEGGEEEEDAVAEEGARCVEEVEEGWEDEGEGGGAEIFWLLIIC